MWIYQQPASLQPATVGESLSDNAASEPRTAVLAPPAVEPEPSLLPENAAKPNITAKPNQPLQQNENRSAKANYGLLTAAFLLGTVAAGWLCALCDARQLELLQYYLRSWNALFEVSASVTAAKLFCTEYLMLAGAATALLLFGFSALGPVLVFLFAMLYGLGGGTLLVQVSAGAGAKQLLAIMVMSAPAAAAVLCLCSLGTAALQVSGRIRAYSFLTVGTGQARCGAGTLVGHYLLTMVLLLPLCGLATAFACIGSRL